MLITLGRGLSSRNTPEIPFILNLTQGLTSDITYARSDTVATYRNSAGKLVSAAANTPRIDYTSSGTALGLLIEGTRTNKVTVYNASPTATTGITLSGTATVALTTDATALTAAGLNLIGNGNVFQVSGGASGGYVSIPGIVGNTNAHSFSVWARVLSGNTGELRTQGLSGLGPIISGSVYKRYKLENKVPSSTTNTLCIQVDAGTSVLFILPQVEEAAFASSEIITSGASATRATDSVAISGLSNKPWWKESEGHINVRYRVYASSPVADQYIVTASNGSSAETIGIRVSKIDTSVIGYFRSASTSINSLTTDSKNYVDMLQSASMAWKPTESLIYHGGSARIATYTTPPNGLTEIRIGQRYGAQDSLFGWIHSVTFYKRYPSLSNVFKRTYLGADGIFVGGGQSLMVGIFKSIQSNGTGGRDAVLTEIGKTFSGDTAIFINGAKGSTAASKTSNNVDYWWDTATATRGPVFDNFYTKIWEAGTSRVKAVIWAQGEEDSHHIGIETSKAVYKQALMAIFSDMRANLGNPLILIQKIGRRSDAYANGVNRGVQTVREVQWELMAENPSWCLPASEIYDTVLYDSVHLDDAGFITVGGRDARCLEKYLGAPLTATLGPKMLSATRSGTTVTVTLTHDGATDFTPTTNISGFKFFDGTNPIAITSAARTNATTVTLTLASTPVSGSQTLYYGFDDMGDIVVANILRDNSPYALPMQTGKISVI